MQIGQKCMQSGVKRVIISGITKVAKSSDGQRVCRVNILLEEVCRSEGFLFLNNSAINIPHLWKDGLHLNKQGKVILARNYIEAINSC